MKILYLHRTQGKGVEGVHIQEMVRAFQCLGHKVDILSPAGLNNDSTRDERRETRNIIHSIISRILPEFGFEILEIFYNFIALIRMEKLLGQKKYDLIYERYAIFSWAGVKAAKKYRIPLILEVNYTSFTPLYRKRTAILKPLAHWLDKKIFAAANGIVVVSTALKEHLIGLGVLPEKIIVCTNAADPEKFNPAISGQEIRDKFNLNGKKVLGFVGGFYPWHGLDLLINSFAEIKKEVNYAALLLIGDGPTKDKVKAKVETLGIQEDVRFIAKLQHDDLPKHIAAFDVAVMPDSNEYGSPMKIYEYMAMGKPVIAPRLGPLEDGTEDGRQGILFSQHSQQEMTVAIKKLLFDDKLRLKMGEAARDNIVSLHTWKRNAEAVLNLYRQIENRKA